MKISKEDFETWLANPITEEVFRAFERLGVKAKDSWLTESWGKGNVDPVFLADLRARSQVIEDFRTITLADLEEWLDDE